MSQDLAQTDATVLRAGAAADRRELELSPYVSTIRAAAEGALRFAFGLPDAVPLAWTQRGAGADWSVHVRIGQGGDQLELDLKEGAHGGWFSGERFSASYRALKSGARPESDPQIARLLATVRRRFVALDQGAADDHWSTLRSALAEEQRFAGIKDRMLRQVSPTEALIRLGFRCNQRCDFCWQDRQWPEPPPEVYHRWLDELGEAGVSRVTFSGGEPTIHRELLPLIEKAAGYGMKVTLQSNCVQLAKDGFADKLAAAGVDMVFVSYHSHLPDVSDDMTRARGTHVRTVKGIANALRAGLMVELNAVVERRNHTHLADHARHIVDTFVTPIPDGKLIGVHYSHPCEAYEEDAWAENLVTLTAVRPELVEAIQCLQAAQVPVTAIGTCGFPPCLVSEAPSVMRSLSRDEQAEGDVSGREYPEPCQQCAFQPHCIGVRSEYLERFGAEGLVPFAEVPEGFA